MLLSWMLSGLLCLFLCQEALSCLVSKAAPQNFYFLPSKERMGTFFDDPEAGAPGPTIIEGCKESIGQFLMIALPIRVLKPSGRTADLFFNRPFRPDPCRLSQSPLHPSSGHSWRIREVERQYELIRRCTYFEVLELDGKRLIYPESQPAAIVERISESRARFRGDLFFLKIQKTSRFAIGIGLNPACSRSETLSEGLLSPGEASGLLNTYIAGDASGLTTDLTAIGSSRVRVLMSPPRNDAGFSPGWPDLYRLEVAFGSLEIRAQKNGRSRIDFSPIVTRPPGKDSVFFLPLSGEVVLSQLSKRPKVVDSWFYGEVVQPAYEGFLPGLPRTIRSDRLQTGTRYRVEMVMDDPYQDFQLFKSGMKQIGLDLKSVFGLPGEDLLEAFSGIVNLSGLASLNGTPELSGADPDRALDAAIDRLTLNGPPPAWPPFYRETCVGPEPVCQPVRQTRKIRHFGFEFTLGPTDSSGLHTLENGVFFDERNGNRSESAVRSWPALNCDPSSSK